MNPQAIHRVQHDSFSVSCAVQKREQGPIQTPVFNWSSPAFIPEPLVWLYSDTQCLNREKHTSAP